MEIYPTPAAGSCTARLEFDREGGYVYATDGKYYRVVYEAGEGWAFGADLLRSGVAHYKGVEFDRHHQYRLLDEWHHDVTHVETADCRANNQSIYIGQREREGVVDHRYWIENFKAIFVPGVYFSAFPNFSNRGSVYCGSPGWNFSSPNRWPIRCTLSATAAEGYVFKNWTLDGIEVSTEASFVAEINPGDSPKVCQYVANFVAGEYKVVVSGHISPSSAEGCSISPTEQTKTGLPGESLTFTFTVTTAEHYRIKRWYHNGNPLEYKEKTKTFTFEVYDHDTYHNVTAELETAHWHVGTGLPVHGEDGQLLHSEDGQIYYDSDRWIYGGD